MNLAKLIRIVTYILVFISAYIGIQSITNQEYTKGLREFMSLGVIPLSLLATIRHIIFSGSIIKNQSFFEFEAGGTNLAIAIAGIVSLLMKMENKSMGLVFLIYAIYLLMGSFAWVIYNPNKSLFMLFGFWCIIGLLTYFTYIAFTKKDKPHGL